MFFKGKKSVAAFIAACLIVSTRLWAQQPVETVTYRSLVSGPIEVLYTDRDAESASQYLGWALEFRPQPQFLADRALDNMRIYIAPSEEEYSRLSGGRIPEWGVAFAIPREDVVIMRSPRLVNRWMEDPRPVLNHELSHVFLDQQLRPAEIPRWFHEGYAVYCADMWGLGDMFEASLAIAIGSFMPLDQLEDDFPEFEARARRAYLQSYTAVDYMFANWDSAQLSLIFERWRHTGSLDAGLRESVGMTLGRFEQNWRDWTGLRYGWLKLLGSATLLWIVAAALFILVYIYRRRRYYRDLEKMKRVEARYRAVGPWMTAGSEDESADGREQSEKPGRQASPPQFENSE